MLDLLLQHGLQINSSEFQPSNIGNETTRDIFRRLQTMMPKDRTDVEEELLIIRQKCIPLQVAPLLPAKIRISHNGNRQDTDHIVKPLFATQRKRKATDDAAPKLPKTKKLTKALTNKKSNRAFVGAESFAEYKALPDASLLDNINRWNNLDTSE
jgi:hypothetical protein